MNTVDVTFPDGRTVTVRSGSRVADLIEEYRPWREDYPVVAVSVNNEITSLFYRVDVNTALRPVTLDSGEGRLVYRRSLCFLLYMAALDVTPERHLVIGHSLGDGYYYQFEDGEPVSQGELEALSRRMREIVDEDRAIIRRIYAYDDARRYFEEHDMADTALLLKHRNDAKIPVYTCGDTVDISHGPLVPSTGYLQYFELTAYEPGFLLRYPNERTPYEIQPFAPSPLLFSVYQEYKEWGRILNVSSAGRLNDQSASGAIRNFIRVNEALHNKKIAEIADRVYAASDDLRIVLIAGPSSSGKTTFTKKLAIQLTVLGLRPITIGLDNYFVPRERTPLDENGEYDFEHIRAIDVPLLNEHLIALFNGEEVEVPDFDFRSGQRKPSGTTLRLPARGVLLMEGIHGLNEELTPRVGGAAKYKIYVSALTQLNLDDHNRVSTTDNRLIRRIVRDYKFRGHNALDTLHMWPSVRRGENRNIFPFQDQADAAFNSALDYELGILRNHCIPLLSEVKPSHDVYHEAIRLLTFLNNFTPIPERYVPENSILREFIGGSGFSY
jgi:uridine kinase